MRYRPFGGHGIEVSAIGLGTSRLNPLSGPKRFSDAAFIVARCLAGGVTYFDTADSYGAGWSERWLGKALGRHRSEVMIATKFGLVASLHEKTLNRLRSTLGFGSHIGREPVDRYSAEYCTAAVEGSLRRLCTDYVDVLLLHSPPTRVLQNGSWVHTLTALRDRGLIRYFGVSARTPEDAEIAISQHGVDVVEMELNACTLKGAQAALSAASTMGTAVVAHQVLGSGPLLSAVSAELVDVTRSQIAAGLLSGVLDEQEVSVALLGMRTAAHARANTHATAVAPQITRRIAAAADAVCRQRRQ